MFSPPEEGMCVSSLVPPAGRGGGGRPALVYASL